MIAWRGCLQEAGCQFFERSFVHDARFYARFAVRVCDFFVDDARRRKKLRETRVWFDSA